MAVLSGVPAGPASTTPNPSFLMGDESMSLLVTRLPRAGALAAWWGGVGAGSQV